MIHKYSFFLGRQQSQIPKIVTEKQGAEQSYQQNARLGEQN